MDRSQGSMKYIFRTIIHEWDLLNLLSKVFKVISVVSLCAILSYIIVDKFHQVYGRQPYPKLPVTYPVEPSRLKHTGYIFYVHLYERETWYFLPMCRGEMTRSRLVWDEVLGKILSLKRRNFLGGCTKLHNEQLLTISWLNSDGTDYMYHTWERWIYI
jgi:hypothetical protein